MNGSNVNGPLLARPILAAAALLLCFLASIPRSVSVHADAKADGAQEFANAGCQHCHGPAGEGTKKGPSLLDVRRRMNADQIKEQIKHGGKSMPAFGDALDDAQLDSLVKLLRAKRWPTIPPPTTP